MVYGLTAMRMVFMMYMSLETAIWGLSCMLVDCLFQPCLGVLKQVW